MKNASAVRTDWPEGRGRVDGQPGTCAKEREGRLKAKAKRGEREGGGQISGGAEINF